MTFCDLPKERWNVCCDDPRVTSDLIDLSCDLTARRRKSLVMLLFDEKRRPSPAVVCLEAMPDGLDSMERAEVVWNLARACRDSHHQGLALGICRPDAAGPEQTDLHWAELLDEATGCLGLDNLGCHLVSLDAVVPLSDLPAGGR